MEKTTYYLQTFKKATQQVMVRKGNPPFHQFKHFNLLNQGYFWSKSQSTLFSDEAFDNLSACKLRTMQYLDSQRGNSAFKCIKLVDKISCGCVTNIKPFNFI